MSVTATTIIANVDVDLKDVDSSGAAAYQQFLEADLLDYLNAAEGAIVMLKPDASVTTASSTLAAGTKQSLPTGGILLMDIYRNMGVSPGTTPGTTIVRVDIKVKNAIDPAWHTATAAAVVQEYMYDSNNPKVFWVSPPQPSSGFGYVEMAYSKIPTKIASTATAINLDDIYEEPIRAYMMHRALAKLADQSPQAAQRSAEWLNVFLRLMGQKESAKIYYGADRK